MLPRRYQIWHLPDGEREHLLTVLENRFEAFNWFFAHYFLIQMVPIHHWFCEEWVLILFSLPLSRFKCLSIVLSWIDHYVGTFKVFKTSWFYNHNRFAYSGFIAGTRPSTTPSRLLVLLDCKFSSSKSASILVTDHSFPVMNIAALRWIFSSWFILLVVYGSHTIASYSIVDHRRSY